VFRHNDEQWVQDVKIATARRGAAAVTQKTVKIRKNRTEERKKEKEPMTVRFSVGHTQDRPATKGGGRERE
jgi:hypothetical protein